MAELVWESAQRLATDTLSTHWADSSFPVDPFRIAKKLGIDVSVAPLPDNLSGMIVGQGDLIRAYVDSSEPVTRQRFTCAHEVGHYIERMELANDDDYSFEDKRGSGHYDLHEFFADEFAGNLLMPRSEIDRLKSAGYSLVRIAGHFGVSPQALRQRLTRLAKIDAAIAR
ncbi:ImmA/IrrE family metallo-endopeptidase [Glutamicibacter creatinolyticus]|uniref:ImmA/IrrE family metallo-endopeptidase n=1 Tax=Glutamicibacter creatinolyticus TaxID=162496 RepID=UPI001C310547|nr:ImmA/IrrE family metallo-endopeptidase [Glutamicibacter creatinolyticus]